MAGSGKTTFLQRLNAHMHQHSMNGYIINLDPAVLNVPYSANVDIRDTVRTGVVMGLHVSSMQKNSKDTSYHLYSEIYAGQL